MTDKDKKEDLAAYRFVQRHLAQARENAKQMVAAAKRAQQEIDQVSRRSSDSQTTTS